MDPGLADFTSRERQSYLAVWPWEKGGGGGGGSGVHIQVTMVTEAW